jgi:hypothetical protein
MQDALRVVSKAENPPSSNYGAADARTLKRPTSNAGVCTHQTSNIGHQTSLELSRQFDGSAQQTQIMITRNLDAAELLQVRRKPLCIEQCEFPDAQMLD